MMEEARSSTTIATPASSGDPEIQFDQNEDRGRPHSWKNGKGFRVALLTPYSGGNLGDAAIQDALIANLRVRLPEVQFSGITLNCENFVNQHGTEAFALCASSGLFYGMSRHGSGNQSQKRGSPAGIGTIKRALKILPGSHLASRVWREFNHCRNGLRFLRGHDLLIVSGGGQLDEEWGGGWGHPFALFKWAMLARMAKVPWVFASVGACKAASATSRFFLSRALRRAHYRSYRDVNSRNIAAALFAPASADAVVPDMAFSLPASAQASSAGLRALAEGRKIIAVSPITYAKPQNWPHEDAAVYERYLTQLANALSQLIAQDYFIVMVWSARADKETISDLLARLSDAAKKRSSSHIHIPLITKWRDFYSFVADADFLIASRLHSTILGFVARKPTIAISFDAKVDWVMQDLEQTEYLLHIRDFTSEDVLTRVEEMKVQNSAITEYLGTHKKNNQALFASQYDALAELVLAHRGARR
ncbi:MAG TPA: polysaccharide pyruvyl transferase family protein [Terriglobales bacterium]|nr:polysaccharide pyruvyl transferase family protein [Terriglobales bacterium]